MGLDMYAYTVSKNELNENFSMAEDADKQELSYWRKFNCLHGWMQDLYYEKGGNQEFNCRPLRLTEADLKRLYEDADANRIEGRAGFFFGDPTVYPEDMEEIKEFVAKAMTEIQSGREVYYDSWW
jgi:protein-disulfide isomerase